MNYNELRSTSLSKEELIDLIPQQPPFRFIDEILEVNENRILGKYRYKKDESFYKGHFPDYPITPGVILLETMAQIGAVALGIYLISLNQVEFDLSNSKFLFSDAITEFLLPVFPGEEVLVRGEKVFFRHRKLRSKIEMFRATDLIASCTISGVLK